MIFSTHDLHSRIFNSGEVNSHQIDQCFGPYSNVKPTSFPVPPFPSSHEKGRG